MASSQICMRRMLLQSGRIHPRHQIRVNKWQTQQTRNWSFWGSSSSKTPTPTQTETSVTTAPSETNLSTPTPQSEAGASPTIEHLTSSPIVKAASDTSSDVGQLLEDAQQAIADPTGLAQDTPLGLASIPERIGYLKYDCGLDFGWGTSTLMQTIFEHLHITAGLSWGASAIVLGLALRSLQLPALIASGRQSGRMKALTAGMKPLTEAYNLAMAKKDQVTMGKITGQMKLLRQRSDVSFLKMFAPILIQIPLGFGAWRTLRNAADLPVPGFVTENWLWTHDLCYGDPYYIVPVVSGLLTFCTMKVNQTTQKAAGAQTQSNENIMKSMQVAFPAITVIFMVFQPGAVQLYFASSSLVGLSLSSLMTLGSFRSLFKLPTLGTPPTAPVPATEDKVIDLKPTTATGGETIYAQPKPLTVNEATVVERARKNAGGMRMPQRENRLVAAHKQNLEKQEKEAREKAKELANRSSIDKGLDSARGTYSGIASTLRKAGDEIAAGIGRK